MGVTPVGAPHTDGLEVICAIFDQCFAVSETVQDTRNILLQIERQQEVVCDQPNVTVSSVRLNAESTQDPATYGLREP